MFGIILSGLRDAKVCAGAFELRAKWTYGIIAVELLAAAALVPFCGFVISPSAALALPLWAVFLAGAAMLLRRYGHMRVSGSMEAIALVYGQGFAILLLLFPLTAISRPLADSTLAAADRAIGFDWPRFVSIFVGRPTLQIGAKLIYNSFAWQPLLCILVIGSDAPRLWRFVTACTLAGLLVCIVYPFAPAAGAFVFFHASLNDFPTMSAATEFGPQIQAIQAGGRSISADQFVGFVSFPSLHAASAVIFSWAVWPRAWLRWPLIILNVLMCVAALLVGGHYLIDALAGIMVGIASIGSALGIGRRIGKARRARIS